MSVLETWVGSGPNGTGRGLGGGVGDAGEEPGLHAVRPPSSCVVCELLRRSAIACHHEQGKAHEDGQRCPHWRKGQRQKVHLESNFVFVFALFSPIPFNCCFLSL
jgi:hypothetical protein